MASKYACAQCKDTGLTSTYERTELFNPHSSPQVLNLFRHYGMKPPKKRGSDRETTESKYLKRYGKKQPVFDTIWRARERRKIISTYLNWPLDAEGRVHTTYGWWPSTWRKGSRDVNLQNIPHKVDLAAMFRRTLVAAPGCVLLEADSAAIEAVLMGFLCGDQELIRLAKAGVHGFFASHVAGQPIDSKLPFPALQKACKSWKKRDPELYERCKRTIHATHYGMTPFGMHDEYQDEFPTLAIATRFQRQYLNLYTSVESTINAVRLRAHKETFLDNHYQYRHRFYDVFSWDQKRYQNALRRGLGPAAAESKAWVLGNDAKRCIAFIPQSDASAIQTEDLLHIGYSPEIPPEVMGWMRLIIHDSFVLEVPKAEADWVGQLMGSVMTRPRPELGGLSIGVEVKVGENLQDTSELEMRAA